MHRITWRLNQFQKMVTTNRDDLLSRYNYFLTREPKKWGWVNSGHHVEQNIVSQLARVGIQLVDFNIDVAEYHAYFEQAEYTKRYPMYFYPKRIIEKSLEHFIAQKLLQLTPQDIYIDIASDHSPVPEIYHRLYGCKTFAQDLIYPPGLHDDRIGGNASELPFDEGAITKMALHCSFEHFEGDSDIGYIRECVRVLAPGGRVVIVPLYLSDTYGIHTNPLKARENPDVFETDAVVGFIKGWSHPFGRTYDPAHLWSRVIANGRGLDFTLFSIQNAKQVDESCYVRYALLISKPPAFA